MGRLNKYFFESLPGYFKSFDEYKDADGKGTLERFLSLFQTVGEEIETSITGLLSLPFPTETQDKFLDYISALFGYPPFLPSSDGPSYRAFLSNWFNTWKKKGSEEGLSLYFKGWGFDSSITLSSYEIKRFDTGVKFDTGITYDTDKYLCRTLALVLTPKTDRAKALVLDPTFLTLAEQACVGILPLFYKTISISIDPGE